MLRANVGRRRRRGGKSSGRKCSWKQSRGPYAATTQLHSGCMPPILSLFLFQFEGQLGGGWALGQPLQCGGPPGKWLKRKRPSEAGCIASRAVATLGVSARAERRARCTGTIAQDLMRMINQQREACGAIISSKARGSQRGQAIPGSFLLCCMQN